MTRDELLAKLKECEQNGDNEEAHYNADRALLAYIADEEVTKAFDEISKWYA